LFGAAALVTMQFVGPEVARFGSAWLIRVGLVGLSVMLAAIGFAHGRVALGAAVFALGAVHGMVDVAMNAHGVAVERAIGRPVMSSCHAAWSISAVVAALLGGALIKTGVAASAHLLAIAAVTLVGSLVVGRQLLPASAGRQGGPSTLDGEPEDGGRRRAGWRTGWTWSVVALGITGTLLMVCDGATLTWSGVFLHDNRGATLAAASFGVTAYTASQTLGRLVGDRLKARFGASAVFRLGGLIGVLGFCAAMAAPTPVLAVIGFAILGLGTSSMLPLTFSAAGHAGGTGPGAATFLARFTTFTYAGILLGPAVIGWVAESIGLLWTLVALIPLLLAVSVLTRLPSAQT
jgi:fucose permease